LTQPIKLKGTEKKVGLIICMGWNNGMLERWPPARRAYAAYASERMLVFSRMLSIFISSSVHGCD